jgi:hypothetical protein
MMNGDEGMATNSMGFEPGVVVVVVEHPRQGDLSMAERQLALTPEVHPSEVLAQLCVLLEEYAPTWYEQRLRHRVLTALRLPTDVLVELCALLEDHAPTWYSEKQHARGLGVLKALGLLEQDTPEESK